MKKYKELYRSGHFFIGSLIFVAVAFLVVSGRSSANLSQEVRDLRSQKSHDDILQLRKALRVEDLKVTNHTQGFTIVGIEKDPKNESISLTLRNDYNKVITAYKMSVGSNETLADYAFSEVENGVRPGAVVSQTEAIEVAMRKDRQEIEVDPALRSKGIIVYAVRFEDGTSDGEPGSIEELAQYRRGASSEVQRILSILEKAQSVGEDESPEALNSIESNLQMSHHSKNLRPSYIRFGASDAKAALLAEIQREKAKSSLNGKKQVSNIVQRLQSIRAKCL